MRNKRKHVIDKLVGSSPLNSRNVFFHKYQPFLNCNASREIERKSIEKEGKISVTLISFINPNTFPLFSNLLILSIFSREPFRIQINRIDMVFWVFGYGSLAWNPGFEYDEKIVGFIKDYRRVFDLACIDHRGTPENPARTCTLEEKEGVLCWGVAYCVRGGPEKEKLVMQYLERRECEYDQKTLVNFYKEGDSLNPALTGVIVFTSTPDKVNNKYYLGPAPLEDMARQIATAHGPCGNNRDYLFLLEKAMHNLGHEEDYVIELANEVRKALGVENVVPNDKKLVGPAQLQHQPHVPISTLPLSPLPEPIALDS